MILYTFVIYYARIQLKRFYHVETTYIFVYNIYNNICKSYKHYSNISMFMKVKMYDWLTQIESKWYGKPKTTLSEEEEKLYNLMKEVENEG